MENSTIIYSIYTPIGIPIFLMLTLGLRFGEAVSLIWSDVDLDKKSHM